jgi:hypothetical protein
LDDVQVNFPYAKRSAICESLKSKGVNKVPEEKNALR